MTAEQLRIIEARWAEIQALSLKSGSHEKADHEFCVMEAVAYVAGEPWADHPACASAVLTEFAIAWNDGLPSDEDRDRLLKPLIPRLVGTRASAKIEERRAYMALDWLIRVHTRKWLDLVPALSEHAKALRDLPEVMDLAGARAAGERVRAAQVASAAARDAARGAAWDAAWDAAWGAARDAAWDAAWAAAADAAWAAARGAAADAAGDVIKPTVAWLQTSALALFERMIAVSERDDHL